MFKQNHMRQQESTKLQFSLFSVDPAGQGTLNYP